MKLNRKVFVLTLLSLLSLSLISAIPVAAFTSDSFSQQVGDILTWEVTYKAADFDLGTSFLQELGDRLKLEVTITNTTDFGGSTWDTLYGNAYKNSVTNRTWNQFATESKLTSYNGTHAGIGSFFTYIIPHNETAFLLFLYLSTIEAVWTSGPNGYDGFLSSWELGTSGLGDLGKIRMDMQYNAEGLAQYIRGYNGTGPGWVLKYQVDLLLGDEIPGFAIFSAVFSLVAMMGLLILYRNRKLQLN